jgi:hypothetical protein
MGATYSGMAPVKFFDHCYQLRSRLVHGQQPFPTSDEVSEVVAQLEVFVSDLLTTHLVGTQESFVAPL